MSMRIRAPRGDELGALIDIERQAGALFAAVGMPGIARDDPGSVAELEPYRAGGRAWVAVDDGDRPIAYLISAIVDDCPHIEQVSVSPAHARRGSGPRWWSTSPRWRPPTGARPSR